MRGTLIGTQTELAETQAELDAWTHELESFHQVGMAPFKWAGMMKCPYGRACYTPANWLCSVLFLRN